jgi:hypothetical protein
MRRRLILGLGVLAVLVVGFGAVAVAQDLTSDPTLDGPDPGLLLNDSPPAWQRHAEPGVPYVEASAVTATALQAGGDPKATITDTKLISYQDALAVTKSGNNLSLGADRQVYLVTLSGDFTFRRHPPGASDRKSSLIYVLIDAITGEVMARGEMP